MKTLTYNDILLLDKANFIICFLNDDDLLIQLGVKHHEILNEMKRLLIDEIYIFHHTVSTTWYTLTFSKKLAL